MTMHRSTIGKAAMAVLAMAWLGLAACATPAPDAATGAEAEPAGETGAAETTDTAAETAVGDAGGVVTDTLRPGMGAQAGGGMHRRMQDLMHRSMLDEAIAQSLITDEDAALFLKVHEAIDPYRPAEGMGEGMGLTDDARKAMQRGFVAQAVTAGTVTQADADRFTAIHDLLIEKGIMARFEGGESGEGDAGADADEAGDDAAATATPGS